MEAMLEFEHDMPKLITYYEHEAEVARMEVNTRRWMIAAIIALLATIWTATAQIARG